MGLVAVAVCALTVSACGVTAVEKDSSSSDSSSSSNAASAPSAGSASSGKAGAKIFVIGGKADDPFWSKVKKGADDAGKVAELTGRLGHLARSAELRQSRP